MFPLSMNSPYVVIHQFQPMNYILICSMLHKKYACFVNSFPRILLAQASLCVAKNLFA